MVNVLAIPEDCPLDQHVLRPLLLKLMSAAGFPSAKTRVCLNPRLGGVSDALNETTVTEIIRMYPMVDLFLIVVDLDCKDGRVERLKQLEERLGAELQPGQALVGTAAIQELEVWVLAGMNDFPESCGWGEVLHECHPKEAYFDPYVEARKLADAVGRGRRPLALEAAGRFARIRSRCPQDVGALIQRISEALT